MKFVSKRDWWISVLIFGVIIYFIAMSIFSDLNSISRVLFMIF